MFTYIKRLIQHPKEIYTARNMKSKYFISFILLISLILTLFSFFDLKENYNKLKTDYQEIHASIPDYELIDGKLNSDQESYIYQTDSLVFYFDPDDKTTQKLVDKNMTNQQAPISFALQKEAIYLNVLGQGRSIKYSDLNLTNQDLQSLISAERLSSPVYFIVILIILFLVQLFLYLAQLFSLAIFANLISFIQKSNLNFIQNAKITLIASIIPILALSLLNTMNLTIPYSYEIITFSSLALFYLAIEEFKKRRKQQQGPKAK